MRTILLSFFVLLCTTLGTRFGFQQWQSQQNMSNFNQTQELNIEFLNSSSGKTLVPNGAILGTNDTNTLEYSYLVDVNPNYTVDVNITNIVFEKNNVIFDDLEKLLLFTFETKIIDESHVKVLVYVSLDSPDSKEQFNLVKKCNISFELTFNQIPAL